VIENRPGAGSNLGHELAAKSDRGRWSRFRAPWRVDVPRTRSLEEWCGQGHTRLRSPFLAGASAAAPANGPAANESQPPR
jgi:hypothetical protein